MRDKIINGKYSFKTKNRPTSSKKEEVRDNRENLARKRSAESIRANNALVAISLAATVVSC